MTKKSKENGEGWANFGILCAVVSVLFPVIALLGIILGCVAMYKGKTGKGLAAVILSVTLGFVGLITGLMFLAYS